MLIEGWIESGTGETKGREYLTKICLNELLGPGARSMAFQPSVNVYGSMAHSGYKTLELEDGMAIRRYIYDTNGCHGCALGNKSFTPHDAAAL